ncbi:MAG: phage tail tube protein [Candidatus Thorarchaeota archaeon]
MASGASEHFSGQNCIFQYGYESTYGEKVTSPDYWWGVFLEADVNRDWNWLEVESMDTGSKDVDGLYPKALSVTGTLKFFPQHASMIAYAMGTDEKVTNTDSYIHGFVDLADEDWGLPSLTYELTYTHATGHCEWYDGTVINSLEWNHSMGEPATVTIDVVSQDHGSSDDSGNTYESSDLEGKRYELPGLGSTTRVPYEHKHCQVEIQGNHLKEVLSLRWKVDNQLRTEFFLDSDNSGRIGEPIPQRRRFEFEVTALMENDTYYDIWDAETTEIGSESFTVADDPLTDAATSITLSGTPSYVSTDGIYIIQLGNSVPYEYVLAHTWNEGTGFTIIRGCFGSDAAEHASGVAAVIRGTTWFGYNKGTDAWGSVDFNDGDEDLLIFPMWDAKITALDAPIRHDGGLIEQTIQIRPAKCAPFSVDEIDGDFIDSS